MSPCVFWLNGRGTIKAVHTNPGAIKRRNTQEGAGLQYTRAFILFEALCYNSLEIKG